MRYFIRPIRKYLNRAPTPTFFPSVFRRTRTEQCVNPHTIGSGSWHDGQHVLHVRSTIGNPLYRQMVQGLGIFSICPQGDAADRSVRRARGESRGK